MSASVPAPPVSASSLTATGLGLVKSFLTLAGTLSSVASHLALPLPASPLVEATPGAYPVTENATTSTVDDTAMVQAENPSKVEPSIPAGAASVATDGAAAETSKLPSQTAIEALLQKVLEDCTSARLSLIPRHLRPSLLLFPVGSLGVTHPLLQDEQGGTGGNPQLYNIPNLSPDAIEYPSAMAAISLAAASASASGPSLFPLIAELTAALRSPSRRGNGVPPAMSEGNRRQSISSSTSSSTPLPAEAMDLVDEAPSSNPFWTDLSVTGLGALVKRLSIPTFDARVPLLAVLNPLLPNLASLRFHHIHTEEGHQTPLQPKLLATVAPLMGMVEAVAIEDANAACWPEICLLLQIWGSRLRNLNIEAVGNMDAFDSPEDLEPVFARLPSLEFLRLDGIPIGTNNAINNLANYCLNLRVLTLDYCLEITMGTLPLVWNGCKNLTFLGLAGIVGDQELPCPLERHENLKTLRLVDCDVCDSTFQEVARRAPALEMIRIVFEDDNCDGILAVSSELSDATLLAFTAGEGLASKNLSTFALTRCPRMTAATLSRTLTTSPIRTLDLHKDPECTLGGLEDKFLLDLADHMSGVRILHLYGQTTISDEAFRIFFSNSAVSLLESVCLNNTKVTPLTLYQVLTKCRRLQALSVIDCPMLTSEDLRFLLYRSGARTRTLERFYTSVDISRDDPLPRGDDLPPPLHTLVSTPEGYEVFEDEIPGARELAEKEKEAAAAAAAVSTDVPMGEAEAKPAEPQELEVEEAEAPRALAVASTSSSAGGANDVEMEEATHLAPAIDDEEEPVDAPGNDDAHHSMSHLGPVDAVPVEEVDIDEEDEGHEAGGAVVAGGEETESEEGDGEAPLPPRPTGPPIYRVPCYVRDEDRWFVDEGLDILSLWEGAVKKSMGPGRQWM
ncbi:hypothetical protein HDU96_009427 [Phlyctochytrium bullatum]|nr:hypothetical protein HDU96_009427 [Phlyctochytrium bullatum]